MCAYDSQLECPRTVYTAISTTLCYLLALLCSYK